MSREGHGRAWVIARPRLKLRAGYTRRKLYKNLRSDEIRLLDIRGSKRGDIENRLDCSLRLERLCDLPADTEYTAVSYTWADHVARWAAVDEAASKEVFIDGHIVPIGQRLEPMLRTLCEFGYATVWIDAICIDQDDPVEQASQVAKMREIYSKAGRTVIFLGSPTAHSEDFFEFLEHATTIGARVGPNVMQGMLEVFDNPYWKRAWIIQEIAVSRRVVLVCGDRSCSWEAFASVPFRWDVNTTLNEVISGPFTADREIRAIDSFRQQRQLPLLSVLIRTRSSSATFALDSVYAKLGLAYDADELVPTVTYRVSPMKLFKRLVKAYVEKRNDLYIICLTRESRNPDMPLPSWVPDWSRSTERRSLLRFWYSGWMSVAHVRQPRMHVTFSRTLDEIRVRGRMLGRLGPFSASDPHSVTQNAIELFPAICRTAAADHFVLLMMHNENTTPPGFIDQFALLACLLDSSVDPTSGYTSGELEVWRRQSEDFNWETTWKNGNVTVADRFQKWYQTHRSVRIGTETVATWANLYLRSKYPSDGPFPRLQKDAVGGVDRSLIVMNWYRMLKSTTSGHPALVPERAADGDLICSLYGCPVPVVLRKVAKAYVLIGECYVDGLMDKLDDHDTLHRNETTFNIR